MTHTFSLGLQTFPAKTTDIIFNGRCLITNVYYGPFAMSIFPHCRNVILQVKHTMSTTPVLSKFSYFTCCICEHLQASWLLFPSRYDVHLNQKYSEGHCACMETVHIKIIYAPVKAKTVSAFARDHWKFQDVDYLLAWGLSSSSGDPLSYCSTSARTHTLFSTSNPQPLKNNKQSIGCLFRNNNWHAVFIKKYTVAVMRTLTWDDLCLSIRGQQRLCVSNKWLYCAR